MSTDLFREIMKDFGDSSIVSLGAVDSCLVKGREALMLFHSLPKASNKSSMIKVVYTNDPEYDLCRIIKSDLDKRIRFVVAPHVSGLDAKKIKEILLRVRFLVQNTNLTLIE